MKSPSTGPQADCAPVRRLLRRSLTTAGFAATALAACCYVSYRLDCRELRRIAGQAAPAGEPPSQRVLALVDWVFHNRGFHENDRYFLLPKLRATPMQVLEGGGDCADKSRLLSAMLRQIGIASTMLMCFDPLSGAATHTVVEARIENGAYMVVDPVYDLWFPRPEGSGFHDLLDLRRNPQILNRRIDDLVAAAPRRSPLRSYNRQSAVYNAAASINWNKSAVTRYLHDLLRTSQGDAVYRISRPVLLEEPKLLAATAVMGMGGLCFGTGLAIRRRTPGRETRMISGSAVACGL